MHRNKARVEPRAQALEQTLIPPPPPAAASKMVAQRQRSSSRSSRRHLAGAVVFLATTAFALLFLPRSSPLSYGIVIDAGSTGSRVHVIAYHAGALTQLDWSRTYSLKATPGLSSFAADPGSGGLSIAPLLEFARRHVPRDSWVHTEVRLMATAGLRLLDIATAEAVMESCRELLRGSGFRFQDQWATIISGADEGIYAWVAANYALGTLGGARQDTTGIIELGGASIQVTFATDKPMPQEFSHVLKFGDITYNLYSHSFLHLGQNVAYESLHDLLSTPALESMSTHLIHQATYKDPCTPKGFSRMVGLVKPLASVLESKNIIAHAVGNFSECRSVVRTLLHKGQEECIYHDCRLGAAFVPDLEGRFLATENFYHTSKFFGLRSKSFLSDLMLAGEQFCHGDWSSNIKRKYRSFNEGELLLFCFSSAYIVALLHDALKVPMDHNRKTKSDRVLGPISLISKLLRLFWYRTWRLERGRHMITRVNR
ncbi:probable apyrase 6 isoform X2 [Hordeum vulgare subsp. vulgare]|uniref:probable apyrase 6 isoform X2 n=1 Tax=Hordeum vulgare subsp. vulgare TaxID=112509 RepID=UPI001D1A4884|nr:probable apyrase 6 isoform X2 [Hordeum vulgare subsp. vulgare]